MEVINDKGNKNMFDQDQINEWEAGRQRGRIFGGILVITAGTLFLLREMGIYLPEWLFSWQMLLIAIGALIGFKHKFSSIGWLVMILIGGAFLLKEYAPWFQFNKFIWPISIILLGLFILFKPKRKYCEGRADWKYRKFNPNPDSKIDSGEDYIEYNAVFGAINKRIISKSFKGGEINSVFGGTELDLTQADFAGTIELEVNSVFGGTRLVIPSNWNVKSEVAAVMGSVEDKRPRSQEAFSQNDKVLILRGNAVFGGIEIQSYS